MPIPLDLNEVEGCRFSSLRKMRLQYVRADHSVNHGATHHPAALDRELDSINGVSIQGLDFRLEGTIEPMLDQTQFCCSIRCEKCRSLSQTLKGVSHSHICSAVARAKHSSRHILNLDFGVASTDACFTHIGAGTIGVGSTSGSARRLFEGRNQATTPCDLGSVVSSRCFCSAEAGGHSDEVLLSLKICCPSEQVSRVQRKRRTG